MSESVIHYGIIIYKYNIYVLQSNKKSGPKIFLDIKRLRKTASSIPLLEEARIKSEWAIRLSDVISPVDAARIGTAGYTAMLCVQVPYLEHSVSDNQIYQARLLALDHYGPAGFGIDRIHCLVLNHYCCELFVPLGI